MEPLNTFFLGAVVMACGVAGLFFLRFWRRTHDRLFAIFAAAFWLLGLNWLLLAFTDPEAETRRVALYTIRLLAFVLIIVAIIDKNRASRR
jgi:hypothetical protein